MKGQMEAEARAAVEKVPGVKEVLIKMGAVVRDDPRIAQVLPAGIKNVVVVASGKGGVGKSTVACNLAVSLHLEGAKVGLLDADVYGPNQPQMMGAVDYKPKVGPDNKLEPPRPMGIPVMSMGFLMDADAPVIWRGPMLHGAVTQFLKDVKWGELDYLIVDLPPGTGDVQLSLCQTVPIRGAVIVTTPQSIAISDVRKAVAMFNKLNVPILGIVENMGEFICPHCSKASAIFSSGGAESLAKKYAVPLLGRIPLDPKVCDTAEKGTPVSCSFPDSIPARAFRELARKVSAEVSILAAERKPLKINETADTIEC
jgi:ATP-binding protein involved in chromosome partitioning